MSSQKGNVKKPGQKHQNTKAFKVQYNPKMEQIAANAKLDRLCERCYEQIKWKLNYGEYKPKGTISRW